MPSAGSHGGGRRPDRNGAAPRARRRRRRMMPPEPAVRSAAPIRYRSALVLRFGRVGDLLVATPALRALRAHQPAARIELLTTATGRATLGDHPGLAAIHTLRSRRVPAFVNLERFLLLRRLRRREYDVVFVLETARRYHALAAAIGAPLAFGLAPDGSTAADRSGHVAARYDRVLAQAGVSHAGWHYDLPVPEAARITVGRLLAEAGIGPADRYIAVHPGHYVRRRRRRPHPKSWPTERWIESIRRIRDAHTVHVVLTGARDEVAVNEVIAAGLPAGVATNAAGRTTMPELAALLAGASLVLSGDTGPAHIAAAVRAPLLALFGPTPPDVMGPLGDEARIRRLHPEPAVLDAAETGGYDPRMWAIGVEDVVREADALLSATGI